MTHRTASRFRDFPSLIAPVFSSALFLLFCAGADGHATAVQAAEIVAVDVAVAVIVEPVAEVGVAALFAEGEIAIEGEGHQMVALR